MNGDTPTDYSCFSLDGICLNACMFSDSFNYSFRPIASTQGFDIISNRESISASRPSTSYFVPPTSSNRLKRATPISEWIESYILLRSSSNFKSWAVCIWPYPLIISITEFNYLTRSWITNFINLSPTSVTHILSTILTHWWTVCSRS